MEHCMDHSAHQQLLERHDRRLDAHSESLDKLNDCIIKLTAIQEELTDWRHEAEARITALEKAPAAKWNTVVTTVITSIISAILGGIATILGLHYM